MLTFMTKTKVVVFVVIALVTTTFLAVHYVGLDRYYGGYEVTVDMPEAGGLFENSEVTYRGVPVGKVTSLEADRDGATAVVRITRGAPAMPEEVEARVVDRSAIGEQYLDLRGGSTAGQKLGEGDHLTLTAADLPPSIDGLLRSSRDMVASIPSDDLNTVIDEGYEFTRGNGANLARLLKTSTEFARTADRNFLTTVSLIDNSGKVLATQEATASSFKSFSSDLDLLAHSLDEQDADWRRLIEQTPAAARQLDRLFSTVGQPLGQLMSNLVSTAEVFGTNADGVKETMIKLPEGISITYAIMTSKGMKSGAQLSFFNPLPCTKGYEGTEMREGTVTTPGKPFNTKAGCTEPVSSGMNVRGPQAVLGGKKAGKSSRTTTLSSADDLQDLMGGQAVSDAPDEPTALDEPTESADPDVAGESSAAAEPDESGEQKKSRVGVLVWVLLAVSVVAVVIAFLSWRDADNDPDRDQAALRDTALIEGTTAVETMTSMDHRDVAAGIKAWQGVSTGVLHDQLLSVGDDEQQMLADQGKIASGRVVQAALTDLSDRSATLIAAVEVTVQGEDKAEAPTVKRNRFSADLVLVDGQWKIENLQQVSVNLS